MQGKKTDNETIYKIMVSMFSTNNFNETARQLKIPVKTVANIYNANKDRPEFTKLYKEKTDDFIEKATRIIDKAMNRLEDSLDDKEERLPVNNLSTVIGTLYDKRALARGEPTNNEKLTINVELSDD